jgi:hypothetical protein
VERLVRLFFHFHKEPEGEKPLLRCAFVDLSKRAGGPFARRSRVMEATRLHLDALADQIKTMKPTHILVAGNIARAAFDQYLRARVEPGVVAVAYVPHPSAYVSNKKYDHFVLKALEKSD